MAKLLLNYIFLHSLGICFMLDNEVRSALSKNVVVVLLGEHTFLQSLLRVYQTMSNFSSDTARNMTLLAMIVIYMRI